MDRLLTRGRVGPAVAGCAGLALALSAMPAMAAPSSTGMGSAVPDVAYGAWCRISAPCTYRASQHGEALSALRRDRAGWAGVDAKNPARDAARAGGPVSYYPTLIGAVAVVAKVPGFTGGDIRLPAATLGEIFSGVITNWNDKRIRKANLRHQLPRDLAITLCVPARASGEAQALSAFLARSSALFRQRVGPADRSPAWKGARVVRGEPMACVDRTAGAITFVDRADVVRRGSGTEMVAIGVPETRVYRTRKGGRSTVIGYRYSSPGHAAMTTAAANPRAPGAYPIMLPSWVAVRADRPMNAAVRATLNRFLSPASQAMLPGLGYAPLPGAKATAARAQLARAR